jgi:Spirocyclase AveC-like
MATTATTAAPQLDPRVEERAVAVEQRKLRPVMAWALLGSAFLALMVYEWGAALIEGDLHATTAGRATSPEWAKFSVHAQEVGLGLLALVTIWFFVVRPWRREGRMTLDGMMVTAWATLYLIQDPWVSWSQTTISYNSTALNLGCPQCHVPGWHSSQALAEPVVWGLGCYIGSMFLATVLACKLMAWVHGRRPRIGKIGLWWVAIGAMAIADLIVEVFWTRTGVYTYGGGDPSLSIFDSHYYKYPLWVGAIWGIAWGSIAAIRYFKDDKGNTLVERGIEDVNTTPRRKQLIRLLAIIGVMNASFAFIYNVPVQFFSSNAKAFPPDLLDRPYLLGGVCGPGTPYACPDPRIPIPRRSESGRVTPDGKFIAPNGLPNQVQQARDAH